MKVKVRIVMMSHLSDISVLRPYNQEMSENIQNKINFIKFLLLNFPDTNVEINPEKEYEVFQKAHANLK